MNTLISFRSFAVFFVVLFIIILAFTLGGMTILITIDLFPSFITSLLSKNYSTEVIMLVTFFLVLFLTSFFFSLDLIVKKHTKSITLKFIHELVLEYGLVFSKRKADELPLKPGVTYIADFVGTHPVEQNENIDNVYVISLKGISDYCWSEILINNQLPLQLDPYKHIVAFLDQEELPSVFKKEVVVESTHNEYVEVKK